MIRNCGSTDPMCKANWLFLAVVAVLAISSLLSGCGKTGDLYLPDKTEAKQAPAADAPATRPGSSY